MRLRPCIRTYYRGCPDTFYPVTGHGPHTCTAADAVKAIQSRDTVFIHSGVSAPKDLISAMTERASRDGLQDIRVLHIHTEGPAPYAKKEHQEHFRVHSLFAAGNVREAIRDGRADFSPIFLREIPQSIMDGTNHVDVAMISISPPDKHGYCSLGVSVDVTRAAVQSAKVVIGQMSPHVPRTFGDGFIHQSHLDFVVHSDSMLYESQSAQPSPEEFAIGSMIAENLVEDGATLQLGIGKIPNAVLSKLTGHRHLGVHTEVIGDGLLDLIRSGAVDGSQKAINRGQVVTSFALGSQSLYSYFDDNPSVRFLDTAFVNLPTTIARNPKVTAINSCIEMDLTGQVNASSIRGQVYSGIGGQMDFQLGARMSPGGKSILAFPSTSKGISRIVGSLSEGSAVTTSREYVDWVVTEQGMCNLKFKSLFDRVNALIGIAHPSARGELATIAYDRWKFAIPL